MKHLLEKDRLLMVAFFAKYPGIHSVHNDPRTVKQAQKLVELGLLVDHGNNQFEFSGQCCR